jgi:hypothetical protein
VTVTDGPLPLAVRQLADAVHTLADPQPVSVNGPCWWQPPLYDRLRGALNGRRPVRRYGRVQRSRLPCSIAALAWLVNVDTTVAGWECGKGTIERLHQLAARGWRPIDCDLINGYSAQLERWSFTAEELLDEHPSVALEVSCPRCEARFAYRCNGSGDHVRTWALRLSADGCACLAGGAFWEPERFEWLARLLGVRCFWREHMVVHSEHSYGYLF